MFHMLQDPIASALVRSLQTCPDIVSLRKELLVATRHVLSTPLKAGKPSLPHAHFRHHRSWLSMKDSLEVLMWPCRVSWGAGCALQGGDAGGKQPDHPGAQAAGFQYAG